MVSTPHLENAMTTSTPVLFLDIDGVINSLLSDPPAQAWVDTDWRKADYTWDGLDWPLLWAEPVVEYLTELGTRVEVRWHTTWQHKAPEFAKIVGLPEGWVIADAPEATANRGLFSKQQLILGKPTWWKYPAAERILTEERRPLLWIDDEIDLRLPRISRINLGALGKVCLVSPDGHTGLLRKHIRQIESALATWEEARGAVSGS